MVRSLQPGLQIMTQPESCAGGVMPAPQEHYFFYFLICLFDLTAAAANLRNLAGRGGNFRARMMRAVLWRLKNAAKELRRGRAARENQRGDAFKEPRGHICVPRCNQPSAERRLPTGAGSPGDQDSCLTITHTLRRRGSGGGGMRRMSVSAERWITHSASGRRTPQTRARPWSTCTAGRASLGRTCSSESRCP